MPRHSQRFKLILTYDIQPEVQDTYFQFMLGEMVPAAQSLGLQMSGAWHTAFGQYPIRLVEFIAPDQDRLTAALESKQWRDLENRLMEYVFNYKRKSVRMREDQFQF